jgi:hypothetical protein
MGSVPEPAPKETRNQYPEANGAKPATAAPEPEYTGPSEKILTGAPDDKGDGAARSTSEEKVRYADFQVDPLNPEVLKLFADFGINSPTARDMVLGDVAYRRSENPKAELGAVLERLRATLERYKGLAVKDGKSFEDFLLQMNDTMELPSNRYMASIDAVKGQLAGQGYPQAGREFNAWNLVGTPDEVGNRGINTTSSQTPGFPRPMRFDCKNKSRNAATRESVAAPTLIGADREYL